ncbi:2-phospho-L-lactate guanylyltransferase [Halioglobus japonicus]|nr:2-phospho-L-lactate guanylyltransferase [Halioglobus japonicus]
MARALLPLKDLVQAKTRLSGLLRPSERRALAQAMAEDVLEVLATHSEITGVTLVSDDPGAEMLATKYGAECWSENSLDCRGLNPLMQRATARLLATSEEPLLVLHCDLPLLTVADISAALASQHDLDGLVVACDQQGRGTNLLAFTAHCVPQFCFGINSCSEHERSARRAGFPVEILQRSGIACDVDEPADLECVMDNLHLRPHSNTAALLYNTELGARITLALATLSDSDKAVDAGNRGLHS